jgi:prefoldin beta subunit
MEKIPPAVQHEINQFQQLEQQYQMILGQKQRVTLDLKETEMAISELEKNPSVVYKSVGSILVVAPIDDVKKELTEKKETLTVRLQTLERQEKRLLDKLKEMQTKIQGMLGGPTAE